MRHLFLEIAHSGLQNPLENLLDLLVERMTQNPYEAIEDPGVVGREMPVFALHNLKKLNK